MTIRARRADPATARAGGAGWWLAVVLIGGVLSILTAPGQTAGLSIFTDPLLDQLQLSRTQLSASYLAGTLIGAVAQPVIGRLLDRFGIARSICVVIICFAVTLAAMNWVDGVIGLTIGYVGLRMLGQGALGLAVTTAIARSIRHRRGLALGVTSAIGSAGISLAPVGLERLIMAFGTARTWQAEAIVVLAIGLPSALVLGILTRPGRQPRPAQLITESTSEHRPIGQPEWTASLAIRTRAFWIIAAGMATSGMLGTALAFHQIAVLGERGLTPFQASANFLPQTVTALLATLATGALVDRLSPRWFITIAMGTLALALVMMPIVQPGPGAVAYGLVLGLAGGTLRGMEAATYASYYGTAQIGTIRGIATFIGLSATAIGPLLLSVGHDLAGSFALPMLVLATIPVAIGIGGLFLRPPVHPDYRDSPVT